MPDSTWTLRGDIGGLDGKVAQLEQAFGSMERRARSAETRVQKFSAGAAQGAQSTKRLKAGLEAAKQVAEGFQGSIGGAAGVVEKFTRGVSGLTTAMGPMAGAAAAGALGITALGFAGVAAASKLVELGRNTDRLVARLEELGEVSPLPPEAIERAQQFQSELEAVEVAGTQLALLLSGELGETFSDLVLGTAGFLNNLVKLQQTMSEIADGPAGRLAKGLSRVVLAIGSGGATEGARLFFGKMAEDVRTAEDAVEALNLDLFDTSKAGKEIDKAFGGENVLSVLEAREKAVRRGMDAEREWIALQKDIGREEKRLFADLAKQRDEDEKRRQELFRQQFEREALLSSGQKARLQEGLEGQRQQFDALAREFDAVGRLAIQGYEAHTRLATSVASGVGQVAGAFSSMAEKGTAAHTALFLAEKGAALTSIGISTLRGMQLAQATVPPPGGQILAGTIFAQGIASAALVAAATIGNFVGGGVPQGIVGTGDLGGKVTQTRHSGGFAPDEVVVALRDEAMLSGQGIQAAGGREAVHAMNRGEPAGGGDVYIQWRNEVYDATLREPARQPGSVVRGIRRDGKRAGHAKRPAAHHALVL
ncbi:MAG: hypothetical protein GY925_26410 [Actinomycetia bacterium]|nr:hypothetical protein [Actinomycetes bacterium]